MKTKLVALLFSTFLFAVPNLSVDLRMTQAPIQDRQSLDWTAYNLMPLGSNFAFQLGGRAGTSFSTFDRFTYLGGMQWTPFSFWNLEAAVRHHYRPGISTATTNLTAISHLRLNLSVFGVLISTGWYEQFVALENAIPIPTFRSDFRERDFLLAFGFWSDVIDPMRLEISLRNFDEIQVNNIHNPFFQFKTWVALEEQLDLLLYGRYQVLLGFGRLDEWSMGIGLKWTPFSGDGL